MTERPILMSAPMVRAILDGTKTQTRRVAKLAGYTVDEREDGARWPYSMTWAHGDEGEPWLLCPYGAPGDRLWVRETWGLFDREPFGGVQGYAVAYRATQPNLEDGCAWIDGPEIHDPEAPDSPTQVPSDRWRPSIHMPRWASRITLEVTEVRVERLHDISEEDAVAEGCRDTRMKVVPAAMPDNSAFLVGGDLGALFAAHQATTVGQDARGNFRSLWCSINGAESWDANPWVWAVSFRRVT